MAIQRAASPIISSSKRPLTGASHEKKCYNACRKGTGEKPELIRNRRDGNGNIPSDSRAVMAESGCQEKADSESWGAERKFIRYFNKRYAYSTGEGRRGIFFVFPSLIDFFYRMKKNGSK